MTMHLRNPRLRNMATTPLFQIPFARTDSFKFSYFPNATLLQTDYQQTYTFVPPYLTLKVIFWLTFNCGFVLLCAIFVAAVVLFVCFIFLFWLCGYTVNTSIICHWWILRTCSVQNWHRKIQWELAIMNICTLSSLTLQKRICYFDNYISHQNCNCWHGFMGWY